MSRKRTVEELSEMSREWEVVDSTISVIVSPGVAEFLKISSWTPTPEEVAQFLTLYLEENSVRFEPTSQRLYFDILEHQKLIGFRLLSPQPPPGTVRIIFKKTPKISSITEFWSKREYMPTPENCARSTDLYQACVLFRMNGDRPLPPLDPEMTRLTLEEMSNEKCYNLDQIRQFVTQFTKIRPKYINGLLAYGPSGTGKSEMLHLFRRTKSKNPFNKNTKASANRFGFLVVFKGVGAHFNRKYVGEGEEMLGRFEQMASRYPHMIICLLVDEAEELVADRDSHSENAEHKKGKVAVLLDMLSDIDNMVLVAATNLVNLIDSAMYRRTIMIFYGRMSKDQHGAYLLSQDKKPDDFPGIKLIAGFTISHLIRYLEAAPKENYLETLRSFLRGICNEDGLEFCRTLTDNLSFAHLTSDRRGYENIFRHRHPLWTCFPGKPGEWNFRPGWASLCPRREDIPLTTTIKFEHEFSYGPSCLYLYLLENANLQYFTSLNRETVYSVMKKKPHNLEEALDQEIQSRLIEYEVNYRSSLIVLAIDELVGFIVENSSTESKTINHSSDPNMSIADLTTKVMEPLVTFNNSIYKEHDNANIIKGLREKIIGTNQSAAVTSQLFSSQQSIAQQNASIIQQLLISQYQTSTTQTIRPLRPLILATIINVVMEKARHERLTVVLQFSRESSFNYFASSIP